MCNTSIASNETTSTFVASGTKRDWGVAPFVNKIHEVKKLVGGTEELPNTSKGMAPRAAKPMIATAVRR